LSLVLEPVYSQSFGTKESTSKEKQVWEGVWTQELCHCFTLCCYLLDPWSAIQELVKRNFFGHGQAWRTFSKSYIPP
jgi:hypothetical protein